MELIFEEALVIAESPKKAIALGLVFLDRIASALEALSDPEED